MAWVTIFNVWLGFERLFSHHQTNWKLRIISYIANVKSCDPSHYKPQIMSIIWVNRLKHIFLCSYYYPKQRAEVCNLQILETDWIKTRYITF